MGKHGSDGGCTSSMAATGLEGTLSGKRRRMPDCTVLPATNDRISPSGAKGAIASAHFTEKCLLRWRTSTFARTEVVNAAQI